MRRQTKAVVLVTGLMWVVAGGVATAMAWQQRRLARAGYSERVDVMLGDVERVAKESMRLGDEIMLLSWLKALMKEFPDLELALVSRQGYSSVLGEVRTELYYRTITVGQAKPGAQGAASPGSLTIQVGLSKSGRERHVRRTQWETLRGAAAILGILLLCCLPGGWWAGRALAEPVSNV